MPYQDLAARRRPPPPCAEVGRRGAVRQDRAARLDRAAHERRSGARSGRAARFRRLWDGAPLADALDARVEPGRGAVVAVARRRRLGDRRLAAVPRRRGRGPGTCPEARRVARVLGPEPRRRAPGAAGFRRRAARGALPRAARRVPAQVGGAGVSRACLAPTPELLVVAPPPRPSAVAHRVREEVRRGRVRGRAGTRAVPGLPPRGRRRPGAARRPCRRTHMGAAVARSRTAPSSSCGTRRRARRCRGGRGPRGVAQRRGGAGRRAACAQRAGPRAADAREPRVAPGRRAAGGGAAPGPSSSSGPGSSARLVLEELVDLVARGRHGLMVLGRSGAATFTAGCPTRFFDAARRARRQRLAPPFDCERWRSFEMG